MRATLPGASAVGCTALSSLRTPARSWRRACCRRAAAATVDAAGPRAHVRCISVPRVVVVLGKRRARELLCSPKWDGAGAAPGHHRLGNKRALRRRPHRPGALSSLRTPARRGTKRGEEAGASWDHRNARTHRAPHGGGPPRGRRLAVPVARLRSWLHAARCVARSRRRRLRRQRAARTHCGTHRQPTPRARRCQPPPDDAEDSRRARSAPKSRVSRASSDTPPCV